LDRSTATALHAIEQSARVLQLNQGTLYPALLRMEQEGWIASSGERPKKNRKARFYSITAAGAEAAGDGNRGMETHVVDDRTLPRHGSGELAGRADEWVSVVAGPVPWLFGTNALSASWMMKFAFT